MSYYLTAHRNGKKINLPVEAKHKYKLGVVNANYYNSASYVYENSVLKLWKPVRDESMALSQTNQSTFATTTRGACTFDSNTVNLLYAGSTFHLSDQGAKADEYVGDKIFIKNITYTINLKLNSTFVRDYRLFNNSAVSTFTYRTDQTTKLGSMTQPNSSPSKPLNLCYRLMLVKFDEPLTITTSGTEYGDIDTQLIQEEHDNVANTQTSAVRTALGRWFNQSRIFMRASDDYIENNQSDQNLNECSQPVYTDQLRESCIWTNKYKVLFDEKLKLSNANPSLFFSKSFSINKNVNLTKSQYTDAGGQTINISTISGDTLKNTYLFLIGPSNLATDINPELYDYLLNTSTSMTYCANVDINTKITYYDI